MPQRIRTVKPELAKHEDMYDLEVETGMPLRFAWVMLFTVCDREGRFEWRPRALKADILPFDDVDFEDVLGAFASAGFVRQYEVDGKRYGCIPSWAKHQVVNKREAQSTIPSADEEGARTCTHVREHVSANVPQGLRQTIFERDGWRCLRCSATDDLTIDHIFPRSIGGTHAPANLRTLCRSCNCARPVAGQALVDDLAIDGRTLDDMQRTCMHVHARGEREGKGREQGDRHPQGGDSPPRAPARGAVPGDDDDDDEIRGLAKRARGMDAPPATETAGESRPAPQPGGTAAPAERPATPPGDPATVLAWQAWAVNEHGWSLSAVQRPEVAAMFREWTDAGLTAEEASDVARFAHEKQPEIASPRYYRPIAAAYIANRGKPNGGAHAQHGRHGGGSLADLYAATGELCGDDGELPQ